MTRHTAAALLASMLTLAAPVTACSSSGSGNHASSGPSATPAVTTATESAADAFDACQDYSAQELLMDGTGEQVGLRQPASRLMTLVAAVCAGADCIDDVDVLRSAK
jgi:hypothetical protein